MHATLCLQAATLCLQAKALYICICIQVVDVSGGTPQVMKYPRKGSFEISYMLREEGHTFAREVTSRPYA